MYRLTIVAGPTNGTPARGASYPVEHGSHSIGRHSENQIVLQSGNVSKKHCVLVVDNTGVKVRDQGSSNGTFVNGQLANARELKVGDRISVGEFVLELSNPPVARSSPVSRALDPAGFPVSGAGGNVVAFPGSFNSPAVSTPDFDAAPDEPEADVMPTDPLGKLGWIFEKKVMPYFYGLNERYEWRFVALGILGAFVILNLVVSISPLLEAHRKALVSQVAKRATVIAQSIAEHNTPMIAAKQETRTEIGPLERSEAVLVAVITDMDQKIIAPASRAGQYFANGDEATYAVRAKKEFAGGLEKGMVRKINDSTVAAIEPIKVFNPQLGKNQVVAMAIVSLDSDLAIPGAGEMSMVYANTLVITAAIGLFLFFVLYRLTLHPFELLNKNIDQALRGRDATLKSPVHFSETDALWTVVDAALKRIPSGDQGAGGMGGGGGGLSVTDLEGPLRAMAAQAKHAVAVIDEEKRILYINPMAEEITGIRQDSAQGQALTQASRDQAFSAFCLDLFERAMPGTEGLTEDFDFSGLPYKVHCASFGPMGNPKCFVLTMTKADT